MKCGETHSRSEGKSSAIISKVKLSVFLLLPLLLLLQASAIIFFSPLSLSLAHTNSLTFYLSPSLSQRKYLFPFILYFDVRVFCFSRRLLFFHSPSCACYFPIPYHCCPNGISHFVQLLFDFYLETCHRSTTSTIQFKRPPWTKNCT